VVKVLNKRFQDYPALLEQVDQDLRPWSIEHPRLSRLVTRGQSNGREVAVFSFAEGKPLSAHLADQPLEPGQALKAIFEVAQGLVAVHGRGLAHGDIRAAKVLWDGEHAALLDGGLGRASALVSGFGQFGLTFGHPGYLAPEALQEHLVKPTPSTDVYSLGILGYEMLCGKLPFVLQSEVVDVLRQHFEAPLPPPPEGVSFSPGIAGLLLRMTAKEPARRLQNANEVVECIRLLLAGKPLPPMPALAESDDGAPGVEVEEFSLDSGDVSADAWGRQQAGALANRRGSFDAGKLKQVGPDMSAKGGDEDDGGGLLAAIAAAASDTETKADKKKRRGGKSRRVEGVTGPSTIGMEEAVGQGSRKQFVGSAIGLGVLFLLLGGGFVFRLVKPKPKPTPIVWRTPDPIDYDKVREERAAEARKVAKAKAKVEEFAQESLSMAKSGNYRAAIALAEKLPTRARANFSPEITSALTAVRALEAARLAKERGAALTMAQEGRYKRARSKAQAIKSWSLDPDASEQLRKEIRELRKADERKVAKLKLPKPLEDIGGIEGRLRERYKAEVKLFPGGGLIMTYSDGAGLASDLLKATKAKGAEISPGNEGVSLSAERKPLVAILPAPFKEVLDLTLEVSFEGVPSPDNRFAVLLGARAPTRQARDFAGTGLLWGLGPVMLREDGYLVDQLPIELPTIDENKIRIELRVTGSKRRLITARVIAGRRKPRRSEPAKISLDALAGGIGFYVEGGAVEVTSLRIRGLIDPKAVE
jgi:protein kinase-like protein